MWIADNVDGLDLPNNELNQSYGVRSSHCFDFVKFFDDFEIAEREADAMNELQVKEPPMAIFDMRTKEPVVVLDDNTT